ncbi:MAG: hypothetical protein DRO06_02495 [Thermoproteota archaeon]|nr:MAG: hypothetical protein DRO06_02495 [Candidatus Korarchaeota archaeon]
MTWLYIPEDLVESLSACSSESEVQDVLSWRLGCRRRVSVSAPGLPRVEADLLCSGGLALEVKLNRRFYEGFGKVLALRELYGLDSALIHVVDSPSEELTLALSRMASRLGVRVLLLDRSSLRVGRLGDWGP